MCQCRFHAIRLRIWRVSYGCFRITLPAQMPICRLWAARFSRTITIRADAIRSRWSVRRRRRSTRSRTIRRCVRDASSGRCRPCGSPHRMRMRSSTSRRRFLRHGASTAMRRWRFSRRRTARRTIRLPRLRGGAARTLSSISCSATTGRRQSIRSGSFTRTPRCITSRRRTSVSLRCSDSPFCPRACAMRWMRCARRCSQGRRTLQTGRISQSTRTGTARCVRRTRR